MDINNPVFDMLCELGICCADEHASVFYEGTRDRADINVMLDDSTGALFLDRVDHIDTAYYREKQPTHKHGAEKRRMITTNDDTLRRFNAYANVVRGRSWLDVGAGSGEMLDTLGPLASRYAGIEPQQQASDALVNVGHQIFHDITAIRNASYDVVTLFHVFEHLKEPLSLLSQAYKIMNRGGRLIIEVPHARDALIKLYGCEQFYAHTFWSEHIFLHTRQTLAALVKKAGFEVTNIEGVQRYPLSNHLYWLSKGKAAGHVEWSMLRSQILDQSYGDMLARLDLTDTIILEAEK